MPPASPSHPRLGQIRNSEWANLRTELTWAYEGQVHPHYREFTDHISGQSVLLLKEGSLLVRGSSGRETIGQAGDWVLPPLGPRLQRFSEDARILSIHLKLEWPGGQPLFAWEDALVFPSARFPRLESQGRRMGRWVSRQFPGAVNRLPFLSGDLLTHLQLQRYFATWLETYVDCLLSLKQTPSRLGQVDARVLEAIQALDRHPLERPFSEKELAHAVGLSVSQLDRLFSRQFGQTPSQYLDRRRLEEAFAHLNGSPLSIKQISYELGFNSLAYFSRWFRQRAGMSPRNYAANAKR